MQGVFSHGPLHDYPVPPSPSYQRKGLIFYDCSSPPAGAAIHRSTTPHAGRRARRSRLLPIACSRARQQALGIPIDFHSDRNFAQQATVVAILIRQSHASKSPSTPLGLPIFSGSLSACPSGPRATPTIIRVRLRDRRLQACEFLLSSTPPPARLPFVSTGCTHR